MKLLKRAAGNAKKQLVLITSEASLMPLAAATKLPVAKTLESKPEVPILDASHNEELDELLHVDQGEPADFDPDKAGKKPVGELAGAGAAAGAQSGPVKPELTPLPIPRAKDKDNADESVELDNTDKKEDSKESDKKSKDSKDKKLKVPNFQRFRLKLILGILLIVILIVGWILANIILPKAIVDIGTNTSTVNATLTLNLDTTAKSISAAQETIPAQIQSSQKTQSQQVATTGQKNQGNSASGVVQMSAGECSGTVPSDVPSGSQLSSSSGLTFITQQDTSFTPTISHSKCTFEGSSTTPIDAQSPGSNYNNQTNFTDPNNSAITATASTATAGGTDNIVQIVAQADITNATQKIPAPNTTLIKSSLEASLQQAGLFPIQTSFNSGTPSNTSSAAAGAQASTVTVTQTITYTMFGVPKSGLQTLLNDNVDQQIDTSKQAILNDGLSKATYSLVSQSSTGAVVGLQASAVTGTKIDIPALKKQIAGLKPGDVQNIINAYPGVTTVTVHYSPFWISSTPKNVSKIHIEFKSTKSNANGG
jgi:hypothetical protein